VNGPQPIAGSTSESGDTLSRSQGSQTWLARRLRERWPVIQRQLPRDLAIVLFVAALSRFVGVAWIMTDSVHSSLAVVFKGVPPRPGELAVFAYSGEPIEGYYRDNTWTRAQQSLGLQVLTAGPRKGDGFIKYLMGVPGDRIERDGQQIWLVKPSGERIDGGRCKPLSRAGIPLQAIAPQVIPPGYVYMWAPNVDALDSRYAAMGLVPISAIGGRGVALW